MAQIFARIFKQWAEQALVDTLADSKHFQKAAVSTVEAAKSAQRLADEAIKDPSRVREGAFALWEALKSEAARDLGGAAALPAPPPPPPCPFAAMSVKQLQAELKARSIPTAGLLEKSELVGALRQAAAAAPRKEEMR